MLEGFTIVTSLSFQPAQLKIQSTPPPSSKDTGFICVSKPPKQSSPGWGELGRVPHSTECCQLLAHVGAISSQMSAGGLGRPGAEAKPCPQLGDPGVQKQSQIQRTCSSATCPLLPAQHCRHQASVACADPAAQEAIF